jgi:hypothetical protein
MTISTEVEQVDTKEYIKSVIKVNLSAIIIMSWFMISGLLSSYYSVVSVSQMIDLCLISFGDDIGESKGTEEKVPWHDFISQKDEKSKPKTVQQEVTFVAGETTTLMDNTLLNYLRKNIKTHEEENEKKKKYHHILMIELMSIITKSIEWDCKVISQSFQFIKTITPNGVILMTSFIMFPIFLIMFFILNLFYTIFAWFKSIYGAFSRCGIVEYFDTVLHKKTGNVDPEALSVIGSLFFMLFYAIIMPAMCFLTIVPILFYLFITLLIIPLYALYLPLKITGKLGAKYGSKTTPFTLGTSMFSNIYTYMNYYSVAFSIVYALVASLLQDAYYFIGCLVAIAVIFMATSFYKQEPFTGGSAPNDDSNDNGNEGKSSSSVDSATPVVNSATPVVDSATPVVDSATPVVDSATPVVDNETPVVNNETPVVDSATPVVDSATPVVDNETPVVNNETPVVNNETPDVDSVIAGPVNPVKELTSDVKIHDENLDKHEPGSEEHTKALEERLNELQKGGSKKKHNKSKSKSKRG